MNALVSPRNLRRAPAEPIRRLFRGRLLLDCLYLEAGGYLLAQWAILPESLT